MSLNQSSPNNSSVQGSGYLNHHLLSGLCVSQPTSPVGFTVSQQNISVCFGFLVQHVFFRRWSFSSNLYFLACASWAAARVAVVTSGLFALPSRGSPSNLRTDAGYTSSESERRLDHFPLNFRTLCYETAAVHVHQERQPGLGPKRSSKACRSLQFNSKPFRFENPST